MKTRALLESLCLAGLLLLLAGGALAQYDPLFSIATSDAGACDVKGMAADDTGLLYLLDPVQDTVTTVDASGIPLASFSTEAFDCRDGHALAFDPLLQRLFIADPVCDRIFVCTTDGILLNEFSTEPYGCFDVEGAAYNPRTAALYILDPVCAHIYILDPATGALWGDFSIERTGCRDGTGLACDSDRGVLMITDEVCAKVFEVGIGGGTLLRVGDLETFGLRDPSGAAYLPPAGLVIPDPICDVASAYSLPLDFADHDIGNIVLTMTDAGVIGFLDNTQAAGSGLIYPAGGSNTLYIGSLWVGRDATYVANRDYASDPHQEWTMVTDPYGAVNVQVPGEHADQEIMAGFGNDLDDDPFSFYIRQESWAFSDNENDDFVIVRYFIHNRGEATVDNLRVGIFLDVDIAGAVTNTGGSDPDRQMIYMTDPGGPYVGASLLRSLGPYPPPLSNFSLIPNPVYIYPDQYMQDDDKYGFLAGTDPDHSIPSAPDPDDYSMLVAAGPITIGAGETTEIPFSFECAGDLMTLQVHADRAQELYDQAMTGIDPNSPNELTAITASPNPFFQATTLRFVTRRDGVVDLKVYDIMGRMVRNLLDGYRDAGSHQVIWDGKDQQGQHTASGVYFVRYVSPEGRTSTQRLVLIK